MNNKKKGIFIASILSASLISLGIGSFTLTKAENIVQVNEPTIEQFGMVEGASIRKTDPLGIRFQTKISKQFLDSFNSENIIYGTEFTSPEKSSTIELIADQKKNTIDEEGNILYNSVIWNIPKEDHDVLVTSKSFIKVSDTKEKIYVSNPQTRSYLYVVASALNNGEIEETGVFSNVFNNVSINATLLEKDGVIIGEPLKIKIDVKNNGKTVDLPVVLEGVTNCKIREDGKIIGIAPGKATVNIKCGSKTINVDFMVYEKVWTSTKGEYIEGINSLTLKTQATTDGDNYGVGYDRAYLNIKHVNFEYSADIALTKDSHISPAAKYGLKVCVNETSYFTAFICPNINRVDLLSTLDGGAHWVQLWGGNFETNTIDYTKALNLKLIRNNDVIELYLNNELIHTEKGYTVGAETQLNLGVTSEGVNDLHYTNIVVKDGPNWKSTKGEYVEQDGNLILKTQATTDGDNYGAGYDRAYLNTKHVNFEYSADIALTKDSHISPGAKYGLKIGFSETSYFSVFICPNINKVVILSTLDGGAHWVQLWGGNFETNTTDYTKALNLKLIRNNDVIELYLNNNLIHTEIGYTVGAETSLILGVTSEGVNDLHYSNIVIKDL